MITELKPELQKALAELGYKEPTEIQRQAIPIALKGHDLVGQSRTGTGKTAAFALPTLHRIDPNKKFVQALILTPTRELAIQVAHDFTKLGRHTGLRTVACYGGVGFGLQLNGLRAGSQVVVGTPGRILDFINRGDLRLENVKTLILDEADVMLDMGFARDVEKVVTRVPKDRQTLLFCVDFPPAIQRIAHQYLRNPVRVNLVLEQKATSQVNQTYYRVPDGKKLNALIALLQEQKPTKAILFCRTKHHVKKLERQLTRNGIRTVMLQGNQSQPQRERAMEAFKAGDVHLLVATDIASRGIHIDKLSHVYNYELPSDIGHYVHRIGRTGRMFDVGTAVTLLYKDEMDQLREIEKLTRSQPIEKLLPTLPAVVETPLAAHAPHRPHWAGGHRERREPFFAGNGIRAKPTHRRTWTPRY